MKMKKVLALGLIAMMAAATFAGCGSKSSDSASADGADGSKGQVYYLNFKPEADEAWQEIAKQYTDETGVPVTVITAASGTYEETLSSEIIKDEAPTLFQVNGPVGLANWKDYCYDLKDSSLYNELTSDSYALYDGDAVAGVAYVIESYGIIVNTKLLEQAGYSLEDIASFDDLKKVAEDITARKDELGFSAFTSAGMDGSSDWRFKTHLANLPIYFEYQDKGIDSTDAIEGKYLDNYKAIWDLYINNATCAPADLAGKTGDDAENEFAEGQAVFYQNGSWEYANLTDKGMTDDELAMIPIYIGAGDEAKQGLCTGTENYWCVNSEASEEDIQATIDFLTWMVTSEAGTKMLSEQIGVIPFKNAADTTNLFVLNDRDYTENGKTPVSWNFTTMPSEEWKNGVGSALTAYAAGTGSWDDVVAAFVDGWASEYAAANN
ncbi:MAG: ABC transporter substrate-binding protein [Pseudobutyrivibrio sp.]|uniref:ABC transporter substrate-binding protein n=1 Tax=Pseudobutyrivibrio sp. TaxID=2014367 RepID=UPI001B6BA2F4|nr:ABC transporter substrate-binding protein [Pseudobutyrivibrio sp.]MBP3727850.1 ABC transporter substrate-binding protein [Pseudobutyrivibrio sp.]MBQ8489124.1 ABC transporter substrate-binding protein [Pseudobutyrivibrio sp.]